MRDEMLPQTTRAQAGSEAEPATQPEAEAATKPEAHASLRASPAEVEATQPTEGVPMPTEGSPTEAQAAVPTSGNRHQQHQQLMDIRARRRLLSRGRDRDTYIAQKYM